MKHKSLLVSTFLLYSSLVISSSSSPEEMSCQLGTKMFKAMLDTTSQKKYSDLVQKGFSTSIVPDELKKAIKSARAEYVQRRGSKSDDGAIYNEVKEKFLAKNKIIIAQYKNNVLASLLLDSSKKIDSIDGTIGFHPSFDLDISFRNDADSEGVLLLEKFIPRAIDTKNFDLFGRLRLDLANQESQNEEDLLEYLTKRDEVKKVLSNYKQTNCDILTNIKNGSNGLSLVAIVETPIMPQSLGVKNYSPAQSSIAEEVHYGPIDSHQFDNEYYLGGGDDPDGEHAM